MPCLELPIILRQMIIDVDGIRNNDIDIIDDQFNGVLAVRQSRLGLHWRLNVENWMEQVSLYDQNIPHSFRCDSSGDDDR